MLLQSILPDGVSSWQIILILIVAGLFLVPLILYFLTLQNTLKLVSPENRQMPPGQVWLVLIPFFGMIWQFFVVIRIAESLNLEFRKREIPEKDTEFAKGTGMIYSILNCVSLIPVLGAIAAIGSFVCWIIYWVKIHNFKTKLQPYAFSTLDS